MHNAILRRRARRGREWHYSIRERGYVLDGPVASNLLPARPPAPGDAGMHGANQVPATGPAGSHACCREAGMGPLLMLLTGVLYVLDPEDGVWEPAG